jgi:tripartite-type tricarboxylate transporter receptor subunit TctC
MKIKMKISAALIAALAIFSTANVAVAQSGYPDHAVRMLVGYPSAGPVDIIARIMADRLSQIWGQPVVVENVSGAGGNIAGDRVAKAAPDGYTLLMTTNAQVAINPSLYAKMTYDPAKDLLPISQAVYSPNILVVPNDVPAKNGQELVAYARSHPGKTFATPEVRKRLSDIGMEVIGNSPKEFAAAITAEPPQWAEVIKDAGIAPSN